jgi:pimeloyl-ACP methyl ester carboxylesterase
MRALLTAAREPGPYVLVAHSWGGLIARLFASQYPNEVAGLVLVDPGSEFLKTSLTPAQWAKFVRAAKKLGEPRDLEAADYEPSVSRFAPPLPCAPSRWSCSPQTNSLTSAPAVRRRGRPGGQQRIGSQRFSTPGTSPVRTAATSSRGSSRSW